MPDALAAGARPAAAALAGVPRPGPVSGWIASRLARRGWVRTGWARTRWAHGLARAWGLRGWLLADGWLRPGFTALARFRHRRLAGRAALGIPRLAVRAAAGAGPGVRCGWCRRCGIAPGRGGRSGRGGRGRRLEGGGLGWHLPGHGPNGRHLLRRRHVLGRELGWSLRGRPFRQGSLGGRLLLRPRPGDVPRPHGRVHRDLHPGHISLPPQCSTPARTPGEPSSRSAASPLFPSRSPPVLPGGVLAIPPSASRVWPRVVHSFAAAGRLSEAAALRVRRCRGTRGRGTR